MGKIGIIMRREYFTMVKNKTFIVMCFLAPVFFAGVILVPAFLAGRSAPNRKVVVVDGSYEGANCIHFMNYPVVFRDSLNIKFDIDHVANKISDIKKLYHDSSDCSILYIYPHFLGACDSLDQGDYDLKTDLYSNTDPNQTVINYLKAQLNGVYREMIFLHDSVPEDVIQNTKREVVVNNVVRGKVTNSEVKGAAGLIFGLIIYIYILLFGVVVMKSVVEEKNTRIVEVIVSSVRPFQLMMGKILAVMLVGLTQFAAWVIISFFIITPVINKIHDKQLDFTKAQPHNMTTAVVVPEHNSMLNFDVNEETETTVNTIMSIPWGNLLPSFVFYFIFGYLMYASIFAAIGSAVDTDANTSQFTAPVTIPLVISVASFVSIVNDPDGPIAKWLSMIPFTSPVVMLMRIPYGGVKTYEIYLSMAILVASFFCMTWIAGRIYRVGILMYGKKVSWKELGKWIFYKA
ncbi:MAG: ABC transporter permease [Bacteroidetes bacterium]|nr:ABC transporter permease [Bacteroidota bacterium]